MRRFSFGSLAACGALLVAVVVVPSAQAQQNAECGPTYPPTNCAQVQADRQANVQVLGNTLERQPPRAGAEIGSRVNSSANQRGGGDLPRTGSSSTVPLVSTAVALVLAGSVLIVLRRRRAESSTP